VVAIELHPEEVIVPVLGRDAPDAELRLLGTGSIIGDGSVLLTANHVAACEELFITTLPNDCVELEIDPKDPKGLWSIEVVERDIRHDLALLRIDGYRPNNPLKPWFDFPLHENWPVLTHEYSTTPDQPGPIRLNPAARQGHITRMVMADKLDLAGKNALEVSFPAVRGSSGAPLIYQHRGFSIIGVLVSNAEYHLLPAHVQISLNAANTLLDEVKYFLPQGVAVNINHLRCMYERVVGTPMT
jgi:hypothetical protein